MNTDHLKYMETTVQYSSTDTASTTPAQEAPTEAPTSTTTTSTTGIHLLSYQIDKTFS